MRKKLCLILAVMLLLLSACGGKKAPETMAPEETVLQTEDSVSVEALAAPEDPVPVNAPETEGAHFYPFVSAEKNGVFVVENPKWAIPVATIQTGLDAFLAEHKDVKIDFIHGADVVVSLAEKKGNFGFILPDIAKNDLFRGVVFDGVLPRKTFSMGEAHEKRYYLEAKAIVK